MPRGSVFFNHRTQAVRIPKAVNLPEHVRSVEVLRQGRTWILVPAEASWAAWFEGPGASADFLRDRAPQGGRRDPS